MIRNLLMFIRASGSTLGCVLAIVLAALAQTPSKDYTQWRGPQRDGSASAFSEPSIWPETLTRQWGVEVGLGYATPLVVGNRLSVFSRRGDNEVMSALDADSGKMLWERPYLVAFAMNTGAARHGQGPKSTPAYADGKLFSIGMTGVPVQGGRLGDLDPATITGNRIFVKDVSTLTLWTIR